MRHVTEYRLGNKLLQHVVHQVTATNHFVCTGEFLQKVLSVQQNSVATKCCTYVAIYAIA